MVAELGAYDGRRLGLLGIRPFRENWISQVRRRAMLQQEVTFKMWTTVSCGSPRQGGLKEHCFRKIYRTWKRIPHHQEGQ
jgi:hypothetical protein